MGVFLRAATLLLLAASATTAFAGGHRLKALKKLLSFGKEKPLEWSSPPLRETRTREHTEDEIAAAAAKAEANRALVENARRRRPTDKDLAKEVKEHAWLLGRGQSNPKEAVKDLLKAWQRGGSVKAKEPSLGDLRVWTEYISGERGSSSDYRSMTSADKRDLRRAFAEFQEAHPFDHFPPRRERAKIPTGPLMFPPRMTRGAAAKPLTFYFKTANIPTGAPMVPPKAAGTKRNYDTFGLDTRPRGR